MLDEDLLDRLDRSAEVRRDGRSALLRKAAKEYLERQRQAEIAEQYRSAYGGSGGLDREFEGWEEQGEWPAK